MEQRTASEVAEMASEIAILRGESEALRRQLDVALSERDGYRLELALAKAAAERELIRATQMHTIMSQVSAGLISGLKKMEAARIADREQRQARQESDLGIDPTDKRVPWEREKSPQEVNLEQTRKYIMDRARISINDPVRPASVSFAGIDAPHPRDLDADEPAGPAKGGILSGTGQPPIISKQVRTDIRDDRLPKVEPFDSDHDDLRELAGKLGVRSDG
jgi:hypothetical protein